MRVIRRVGVSKVRYSQAMLRDGGMRSTARVLRRNQTKAERILWGHLANRRTAGAKFRRQQPIGRYIVDFVSFEHRVVVEVDGGQHDELANRRADQTRSGWLETQGYTVMRFWNNEVQENLEGVVHEIRAALLAN